MRIHSGGKVRIGSLDPISATFQPNDDVDGQIRMRGTMELGYIPVSDADGVMTWTDPSTITTGDDGDWAFRVNYLGQITMIYTVFQQEMLV